MTGTPPGRSRRTSGPGRGQGGQSAKVPFPARVIIVDQHDLPRYGLRGMLGGHVDFEIVTEATDGRQAVALCHRFRPDLVLMEVSLPGLDGISATPLIRRDSPDTRVVIVTATEDPAALRLAIEAGAAGYLLKTSTCDEILAALRRVLIGEPMLDQALMTRALQQLVVAPTWAGVSLTGREQEVLRLLALGRTNREIGAALAVSERTAKAHVERIIGRLGVANRTEAVAKAIGLGLIAPPTPA